MESNRKVVYALFPDHATAAGALDALLGQGIRSEDLSILVDHEQFNQARSRELPIAATDARRGVGTGIAVGGASGALLAGLLAGPFGLLGVGPIAAAVFGAAAGSLYGALGGALYGASLPKDKLDKAAEVIRQGGVMVTVHVRDDSPISFDAVHVVLRKFDALHVGSAV